jgi:hypothetical protein
MLCKAKYLEYVGYPANLAICPTISDLLAGSSELTISSNMSHRDHPSYVIGLCSKIRYIPHSASLYWYYVLMITRVFESS